MGMCHVLLLGGIGSGKSSVGRLLAGRGAVVLDADAIGHKVLEIDEVKGELEAWWPSVMLDGVVDRSRLASIVFTDEAQLHLLEGITHPRIKACLAELISASDAELVVVEMPVLHDLVDGDWFRVVVDAPDQVRLCRLIQRGMNEQDGRTRMRSQPSRQDYVSVSDFVIDNSGTVDALHEQVDHLKNLLTSGNGDYRCRSDSR